MAVFAPIPSPSASTPTAVKAGFFRSIRAASFTSCINRFNGFSVGNLTSLTEEWRQIPNFGSLHEIISASTRQQGSEAFSLQVIHQIKGLTGHLVACAAMAFLTMGSAAAQTGVDFFEKNVRPLFAQRCVVCHAAVEHPAGNLRMDNRDSLLQGGSRGPAIVAGKPEESLIIRAVRQTGSTLKMPPGAKLSDAE